MAALLPSFTPSPALPTGAPHLVLYPNHNVHYFPDDNHEYWSNFPEAEKLTSKQWVDELISIGQGAEAGKWNQRVIIGGCCGTAIDEIAELRKGVDAL